MSLVLDPKDNWRWLKSYKNQIVLKIYKYFPAGQRLKYRVGEGEGAKRPPTSFSPITSTNIGTNSQNFLTFSFDPFATLV